MRLNIPKRVKRASGVTFYSRATGWEAEQEESRWVRANERDSTWGHQHEWVGGENEREKKIQKLVRAAHLLYMERNKTTIPPPLPPRSHTHTQLSLLKQWHLYFLHTSHTARTQEQTYNEYKKAICLAVVYASQIHENMHIAEITPGRSKKQPSYTQVRSDYISSLIYIQVAEI